MVHRGCLFERESVTAYSPYFSVWTTGCLEVRCECNASLDANIGDLGKI